MDTQTTNAVRPPTQADLHGMRVLLGLRKSEVGELIGVTSDEARTLERMRTHFVYDGHAKLLSSLLESVNALIEISTKNEDRRPVFLFTFPNDAVFKLMEPELELWMRFNSVHTMFTARLADEWERISQRPTIVEIVPTQYEEFLTGNGLEDSYGSRVAWAHQHIKVIDVRKGMPVRRGLQTEAKGPRRKEED